MSIYKIMQFVQIFTFMAKPFTFHEFHKKFYSSLSPSDKLRLFRNGLLHTDENVKLFLMLSLPLGEKVARLCLDG